MSKMHDWLEILRVNTHTRRVYYSLVRFKNVVARMVAAVLVLILEPIGLAQRCNVKHGSFCSCEVCEQHARRNCQLLLGTLQHASVYAFSVVLHPEMGFILDEATILIIRVMCSVALGSHALAYGAKTIIPAMLPLINQVCGTLVGVLLGLFVLLKLCQLVLYPPTHSLLVLRRDTNSGGHLDLVILSRGSDQVREVTWSQLQTAWFPHKASHWGLQRHLLLRGIGRGLPIISALRALWSTRTT